MGGRGFGPAVAPVWAMTGLAQEKVVLALCCPLEPLGSSEGPSQSCTSLRYFLIEDPRHELNAQPQLRPTENISPALKYTK